MKLLSITLARLTVVTQTGEFNPRNRVSIPDVIHGITNRYGFVKSPKTVEELDLVKGIVFGMGKLREINIAALNLYNVGTVIDTGSSTKDSYVVYEDLVKWAMELTGTAERPGPDRLFFLSELSFQSDSRLDALNKAFAHVVREVSRIASEHAKQQFDFETTMIGAMPDASKFKVGPAAFRIDRLATAPFEDKKYWSSAPLPTEDHIRILEEFEKYLGG